MILGDQALRELLYSTPIVTGSPDIDASIQPASIDLHFGESRCGTVLQPKTFTLASTVETIALPIDFCAHVDGISSFGRRGVFVQNAGWIDPGFEGQITLELFNATKTPVFLRPRMRICQLVIERVEGCVSLYNGRYQHQTGPTPCRDPGDPCPVVMPSPA